jgi:hypothetical protein
VAPAPSHMAAARIIPALALIIDGDFPVLRAGT